MLANYAAFQHFNDTQEHSIMLYATNGFLSEYEVPLIDELFDNNINLE